MSGKLLKGKPTVTPYSNFNVTEDGTALRGAMKGLGTDEAAIINILTARSNSQRNEIAKFFTAEYGRNLENDLKSELGGRFEDVILALMQPPVEYLARQLNKAMTGITGDTNALIEILCPRTKQEVQHIVDTYEKLFDRPLVEHVCSVTKGDLRRLLTLILTGVRNAPDEVAPSKAREQAESLFSAGEAKLGTSVEVFNKVLAHESYEQLKLIFEEYKAVSGRTIEQTLRDELGGPLRDAMLAIVECVQSPVCFYAKQLRRAMAGIGTDDAALIRLIVSRSEIDLGNIKHEFERLFDKTLESVVKTETSGDYKKALVALIGGP